MNHAKTVLGVLFFAIALCGGYLLDLPSETDALQADSLNLSDAIADARSAKE